MSVMDRLLGPEEGALRGFLRAIAWTWSIPIRDYFDRPKLALLRAVRRHTMVSYARLSQLRDACLAVEREKIPGAFVECGVWRGGAAAMMAVLAQRAGSTRKTWLFDSFEGLPEPTGADGRDARGYAGGRDHGRLESIHRCVAPLDDVRALLFDKLKLDESLIAIRKGWFQETLPAARAEIGPIAVLRLDGDWYESTRVALENLYDSVVPNGFVILDDYFWWEGCRRAVDEFTSARGIRADLQRIDNAGACFRKV